MSRDDPVRLYVCGASYTTCRVVFRSWLDSSKWKLVAFVCHVSATWTWHLRAQASASSFRISQRHSKRDRLYVSVCVSMSRSVMSMPGKSRNVRVKLEWLGAKLQIDQKNCWDTGIDVQKQQPKHNVNSFTIGLWTFQPVSSTSVIED